MKRKNQQLQIAQEVINLLTDNEDYRQDLWVCYLSGLPFKLFPDFLNKKEHLDHQSYLFSQLWHLMSQYNPNLLELLQDLPTSDRYVILLLMLGKDISAVSRYKGISQVCVQRIINNVGKKIQDSPWLLRNTLPVKKRSV